MGKLTLISKEEVIHVAKLANLNLKGSEIAAIQRQLSGILGYVALLNEIDTKDVPETAQVTGLHTVVREIDGVGTRTIRPENAVGQAPSREGNYIKVAGILRNRE